jgi:hypothetical protein
LIYFLQMLLSPLALPLNMLLNLVGIPRGEFGGWRGVGACVCVCVWLVGVGGGEGLGVEGGFFQLGGGFGFAAEKVLVAGLCGCVGVCVCMCVCERERE